MGVDAKAGIHGSASLNISLNHLAQDILEKCRCLEDQGFKCSMRNAENDGKYVLSTKLWL